jgi:acid ceramidase
LTGIKPGVFSISINERNSLKGGYIGLIEWIYNINRNQSFITFAIRDMLTKSESYDQSVKYLAEVLLLAPCYYILAGPKAGQVRKMLTFVDIMYFSIIGCDYNSCT